MLFFPPALTTESYPAPSQFSTCLADCPQNAFMLLGSEPAWVGDVLFPLRELIASLLLLAIVARLAYRISRATRLMRRTLVPFLLFAILRTLSIAVNFDLRRAGIDDSVLLASTTVTELGLPAMCIGFFIGLVRWRIHTADSLLALARGLRGPDKGTERRDLIAATLSDTTVDLAFRKDGGGSGLVDADGRPFRCLRGGPIVAPRSSSMRTSR
jgi:hypothetical protein